MLYLPSPSIDHLERQALDVARERSDDGGVWPRSSDRSYVIFCVGQKEHQIRRFLRFALRSNLGFKPLRGCYKGKEERSFIVNTKDIDRIKPFIEGQESILLLHSYNRADVPLAVLIDLRTKEHTELGLFVMFSTKMPSGYDSWTFDPLSGWYFVTERRQ